MSILFYLTFILFSLGQIGRLSFFGQQVNIYLYEIFILINLFFLILKYSYKPLLIAYNYFKSIYIFFLILLFSFLINIFNFNSFENLVGFLYLGRLMMYFLYFFYLIYHLKKDHSFENTIKYALIIFLGITVTISLIQYFLYPDLRNLSYLGWDPHLYRVFSVFFDTSAAGAVFGLSFFFILLESKRLIANKFLRYFFIIIFFLFVLLTYSRSLYFVFFIILLNLFIKNRLLDKALFVFFSFLILISLIPKPFGEGVNLWRTFSIKARIEDQKSALKIWQKHPFLGIGYNRIRYVKKQMNLIETNNFLLTHAGASFSSSFLIILVSAGIIGLISFLSVLYSFFQLSYSSKIYILFLGLLSLVDNILLQPMVLFLFLSIISLQYRSIFFFESDR